MEIILTKKKIKVFFVWKIVKLYFFLNWNGAKGESGAHLEFTPGGFLITQILKLRFCPLFIFCAFSSPDAWRSLYAVGGHRLLPTIKKGPGPPFSSFKFLAR